MGVQTKNETGYVRLIIYDPIDPDSVAIAVGDRFGRSKSEMRKAIKQMNRCNAENATDPQSFIVVSAQLCNGDCANCQACADPESKP